jgi:hypothetical protein
LEVGAGDPAAGVAVPGLTAAAAAAAPDPPHLAGAAAPHLVPVVLIVTADGRLLALPSFPLEDRAVASAAGRVPPVRLGAATITEERRVEAALLPPSSPSSPSRGRAAVVGVHPHHARARAAPDAPRVHVAPPPRSRIVVEPCVAGRFLDKRIARFEAHVQAQRARAAAAASAAPLRGRTYKAAFESIQADEAADVAVIDAGPGLRLAAAAPWQHADLLTLLVDAADAHAPHLPHDEAVAAAIAAGALDGSSLPFEASPPGVKDAPRAGEGERLWTRLAHSLDMTPPTPRGRGADSTPARLDAATAAMAAGDAGSAARGRAAAAPVKGGGGRAWEWRPREPEYEAGEPGDIVIGLWDL